MACDVRLVVMGMRTARDPAVSGNFLLSRPIDAVPRKNATAERINLLILNNFVRHISVTRLTPRAPPPPIRTPLPLPSTAMVRSVSSTSSLVALALLALASFADGAFILVGGPPVCGSGRLRSGFSVGAGGKARKFGWGWGWDRPGGGASSCRRARWVARRVGGHRAFVQ